MDPIRNLLEQQPLMALFLTIGIGHLAGRINVKGVSLGVGAVLFVALLVGWSAPKAVPPPMVGTFGLALFLYAVGVQYGKQFVLGLTSAGGRRANLIALAGVLSAGAASLAIARTMHIGLGPALGLFAGSATSTPTLQAAIAAIGNDGPAVGYSMSYPLGVAGPILVLSLGLALLKPKFDSEKPSGMERLEVALRNPEHFGHSLAEVMAALPRQAHVVALRSGDHNEVASPAHVVAQNDVLLVVAPDQGVLEEVRRKLGPEASGRMVSDRGDVDYLRVFASRAGVVGRPVAELALPGEHPALVAQIRRGDRDLLPGPGLVLDYGDRVGILAHASDFAALRRFFGDSIKGTAEFSYVSIGLGMALGLLLGAARFPVPGIGSISLGMCGVLMVALLLGNLRHTGGINWTIPLSANIVLRDLGLTVFLAQVGMASGPRFAATVADSGLQMFGLGAIVLAALVLPVFVIGLWVCRLPYDEVAGIVSGACGSAVFGYANRAIPTDRPDIGYAMIYPGMTIAKILFVSIVPALFGG